MRGPWWHRTWTSPVGVRYRGTPCPSGFPQAWHRSVSAVIGLAPSLTDHRTRRPLIRPMKRLARLASNEGPEGAAGSLGPLLHRLRLEFVLRVHSYAGVILVTTFSPRLFL